MFIALVLMYGWKVLIKIWPMPQFRNVEKFPKSNKIISNIWVWVGGGKNAQKSKKDNGHIMVEKDGWKRTVGESERRRD